MIFGPPTGASGRQAPAPSRRSALIVWAALLVGVLLFAAVATVVGPEVRQGVPEDLAILVWIALALAIVNFLLSRILPGRMKTAAVQTPDGIAMARMIVAAALNEGAALFCIVAWMLVGQPLVLVPFAVSILGLLLAFPSESRWRELSRVPGEARRTSLVR